MSEKKLRRLPLAAAALVACVSAQAEYQSPDGKFRLSGFGTIGVVRNGTDDAEFNYPGQLGGATKRASLNPDSKIAVQGTYKLSPTVSATTQVLTKYDAEGQYIPNIEWAFAKWQAAPALSFRAGRMGAPYFMVSDFRDVGYANTMARPNIDVYGQVPVSQFQGADASYQMNIGSSTVVTTLWAGDSKAQFAAAVTSPPLEVLIQGQIGLNIQADLSEGWSLRLGHMQGKLSLSNSKSRQLADFANQLAAGATQYASSAAPDAANGATAAASFAQVDPLVNPSSLDASFTGVGLTYDQDAWVISGEFTKRKVAELAADTTAWYGNVGYRVGKFTPYFGLSKIKSDRRASNPVVLANLASAPDINAQSAVLHSLVDNVLGFQKMDQKTTTLGVRWDAMSNLAIKAQLDRITKPADSNGMFFVPDPASTTAQNFLNSKRAVNVMTLSVDFVF